MGLTKVAACFVVVLLLVGGREVSADCLTDCYANCIGYESSACNLRCYISCRWTQKKEVEALVAKLTPEQRAKLEKLEYEEARKHAGSGKSRKLMAAMEL